MSVLSGRPGTVRAILLVSAVIGLLTAPAAKAADPIAFRSSSTGFNGDGATSVTVDKPAGTAEGDFMLAQITYEKGTDMTVTPPDGWDLVERDDVSKHMGQAIYSRRAGASEPASYTWTFSEKNKVVGGILAYQNVNASDSVLASNGATGDSTSIVAPDIPSTSGTFLVSFFGMHEVTTLSQPAGMTERYQQQNTNDDDDSKKSVIAAYDQADPGSNEERTSTAGKKHVWVGHSVLLTAALDPGPDSDGDTIPDVEDNCDTVQNADQTDTDKDGAGDACDDDDDNDGQSDDDELDCGSDPLDDQSTSPDNDNDGEPDCVDDDDDNDGYNDEDEEETGDGNNEGSDPLDPNSTPEVCDGVDNDGNEGTDEGCDEGPGRLFVDSTVTMFGDGSPFFGDVESPRARCARNRTVQIKQRVTGPDKLLETTKTGGAAHYSKFTGNGLEGGFYAKIPRKRFELSDGTKVICKANRSRPILRLPAD